MLKFITKIIGLKETQENLRKFPADLQKELHWAMRSSTGIVERGARENAPVDTGVLRASITSSVTSTADSVKGVVGSPVKYAGFMEEGTPPHWPPLQALEGWARRHGTTAYLVARAISIRGTKARRYLGKALEDSRERIFKYFEDAVRKATGQ